MLPGEVVRYQCYQQGVSCVRLGWCESSDEADGQAILDALTDVQLKGCPLAIPWQP